ncbi:uncharacterized protein I303_101757 [Kwoniella dejecticola CBS 10117]|uniref:Uncharacterized protein n=1 Tax=Kwoniella dejecticola CBS 10117 TaxID=1296121 RepID=A0A1A6ACX1_9TREE|nr:uncharacterized protein I303_02107 [Kwoniella dejecticola CBS 10117]OBR87893.1 hypothetical protein I303_02107 [Kwoniella dejecticola CBS 10117]
MSVGPSTTCPIWTYANAAELVAAHAGSSMPTTPPISHRFPGTRVPDKHTKAAMFGLCAPQPWDEVSRASRARRFPRILVKADTKRTFKPNITIPYRQSVPIDDQNNRKLFLASNKLRVSIADNELFNRAQSELANQAIFFEAEGSILSLLFSLDENGSSVFFEDLPPLLKTAPNALHHAFTKNNLEMRHLERMYEKAAAVRRSQIHGKTQAQIKADPLLSSFVKQRLTNGGSIPDHLFGLLGDAGVAVISIEEKRMYPGALLDFLRILAHHKVVQVFMGGDHMPAKMATKDKGVWIGSPEAGHWYAKLFSQVFAECQAMDSGFFVLTDRYHSIFGRCSDADISILHVFTHNTAGADTIETPLAEFERTGIKPKQVEQPAIIPAVNPRSRYGALHSYMNLVESLVRMIFHASAARVHGPDHPFDPLS